MSEAWFDFELNGERVRVEGASATMTLLQYLRATGRTGTKEGCAEGDCGACTVVVVERGSQGEPTYRAINSCITLLPMMAGREVLTVEGLALRGALHPVQREMAEGHGSQCGYCTPGFVMSMFEGYHRENLDPEGLGAQLCGNLCRCTGYRPIREAMDRALAEKPSRPADLFQLRLGRELRALPALDYRGTDGQGQGQRFFRPTRLDELLRLRADLPGASLVAGATEIGVEINKKMREFPLLISTEGVAEITRVERRRDGWRVGGAATLSAVEDAIGDELPALRKMLLVFASRQIRNRATVAGNLVNASPIGDLAPVLLSLDAQVDLASVRGRRTIALADFFTGYRKTVLAADEVMVSVWVPRPAQGSLTGSYKVSKRREMDISAVAASFRIERGADGIVTLARLAYGGVAATPARARRAEELLEGQPWGPEAIGWALAALAVAFTPLDDVRAGAEFRRGLVVSLFEKFVKGEESEAQDRPLLYGDSDPWPANDAGRELRHESSVGHVTGQAIYVDDQASRRGKMLELWPVLAPHAHARIKGVDVARARALPGVVRVMTAADVPGTNDVGAIRHDEPLFARDSVQFHGQVVAIVAADTIETARRAAALVAVDYEPLPAVLGLTQAIAEESYHTAPHIIRRGDVAAALEASPHRLEGAIEMGGQEHFYLESHAAWAERGDDGDVRIVSSTQHPSEVQAIVSHVLDIARHRVVIEAPRMGGGFGGKETQAAAWAAMAALVSWDTGRPARIQLDRDVDLTASGKRHPFHGHFEVGFDHDGRLRGLRAQVTNDGGWALDLSESICDRALFHIDNGYLLPTAEIVGRVARTNTVSNTAFRGFGGPQGMIIIEEVLDRIARHLGLPVEQVRERNLYRGEDCSTHYGQPIEHNRMPLVWDAVLAHADFAGRRLAVDAFNAGSERIKRGLSVTPVKFGISFTASFLNQAGALVLIYRDGSVQVNHGGTEMGQGLNTKMLGVTMRELGVPASRVRVMKTQTDKVPNTSATAASSGSDLNGAAVAAACAQLRERLAPVAAELLERLAADEGRAAGQVDPTTLRFADDRITAPDGQGVAFAATAEAAYLRQVSLSASGFYRTPGIAYDKSKGHGKPFHYFTFGAAVAEVEVDGWSGMKRIRRVDIVQDVGESLNPGIDRGQIEGAFVQGAGWLTSEELKWTTNGRLLTHSASTYQIPALGDAPADFHVHLLPHAAQPGVIHGSKAVGEPPLMLAMSVREALRDAVAAFGIPGGQVPLPSPATHEALFLAVQRRLAAASAPANVASSVRGPGSEEAAQ